MIGLNRIYNEDCLEGMKRIPDASVDCIICDLPYGTTRNKWDSIIPFEDLWEGYKRIIKPNGAILLFAQTPFDKVLGASNLPMLHYEWIWKKARPTGHLNAKKAPMKAHENILVFYKNLPVYHPQMEIGKPYSKKGSKAVSKSTNYGRFIDIGTDNKGTRYPVDVLEFKHDLDAFHPTQKPVNLIRYLIRTYTNVGDTIMDNCMGSGTTAIACIKEKRNFIGFELNKEYFTKATKRIEAESAQLTLDLWDC